LPGASLYLLLLTLLVLLVNAQYCGWLETRGTSHYPVVNFEPSDSESLRHVALRAEKQSELNESPERCILFSHPEQPELADCGWNVTHNIQDDYWGDPKA
jgi:hypothetical protein